ncbi:MAG: hypothetical protein Q8933_18600 [Bacteroidota bacterium]|nr:hypothetical protein [Bacteroidota bacterium]
MQRPDEQNISQSEKWIYIRSLFSIEHTASEPLGLELFKDKIRAARKLKNPSFSSVIIPFNLIPYYVILDETILEQVESWLSMESPVSAESIDIYYKVKDLFIKWLYADKEADIIKYSNAISSFLGQNNDERNYPLIILIVVYFIYEGHKRQEALDLITKSKRVIGSLIMDTGLKNRLLYILSILSGILFYKERRYEIANQRFQESLSTSSNIAITAKFFTALTQIKLDDKKKAVESVQEIVLYDIERLRYLIEINKYELFDFFLNNPETSVLLIEDEFAQVSQEISDVIDMLLNNKNITPKVLLGKIDELKKLELEDIYSEQIISSIRFISTAISENTGNESFLFRICLFTMHEKLQRIIDTISILIRTNYEKFIERKIHKKEGEIIRLKKEIELKKESVNAEKEKTKLAIDKALADLDINTKKMIEYNKGLLEKLGSSKKEKPAYVFRRSIISGAIITALVIIVSFAAFINGSNSNGTSAAFNALKLGTFSLILCIISSIIITGYSVYEINKKKKRLISKINKQHVIHDEDAEKLRKREQDDLNRKISKFENEIDMLKQKVEVLEEEKRIIEDESEKLKESEINYYQTKLSQI